MDFQKGVAPKNALINAVKAAAEGAKLTAQMIAKRGRLSKIQTFKQSNI
jgi:hypothetical protein